MPTATSHSRILPKGCSATVLNAPELSALAPELPPTLVPITGPPLHLSVAGKRIVRAPADTEAADDGRPCPRRHGSCRRREAGRPAAARRAAPRLRRGFIR